MTLEDELAAFLRQPWLLVGVGSDLRGDDAFGPLLARRLAREGLPALDGGTAPESLTGPIGRSGAEALILADVGDLGEPAGALRLLEPEVLAPGATSTHDPSLSLLIEFLEAQRPLTVRILAAQPARRGLGNAISPEIADALDRAGRAFLAAGR